jgi:peptidoglycan/LPS O-acetylase OafA/YrhL
MGILRFLLAVSVIIAHTAFIGQIGMVGGLIAVETFFVISGFYISLILNEKYIGKNDSYWLFISNRLLRLLPIYWIVLVITVFCVILIPNYNRAELGGLGVYKQYGADLSLTTWIYLIFTNVFVFFQDTALFLGISHQSGNLFYTNNFAFTSPPLYQFLAIPQAWSIGIELLFYVLAPFILKRRLWIIFAVMSISLLLKIFFLRRGLNYDPWIYRFFPFELGFFLLGAIAYFIYNKYIKLLKISLLVNILCLVTVILFTVLYNQIHFKYTNVFYTVTVFAMIPLLFKFTKNIKFDRLIGELSYPIYITHILIRNVLTSFGVSDYLPILTLIGSITLSFLLIKLVGDNIERARQSRVKIDYGVNKEQDALSVKFN